jgi:DNA (cytosine-5)-methyltransferase 1
MRVAGLFAGIGGVEEGLASAFPPGAMETVMLCEWWPPAQRVLAERFPSAELRTDVRELGTLPRGLDLLTAGFPCTDLSQAGRTAGIGGSASGLVSHVFEALWRERRAKRRMPNLMIENVVNMLALGGGRAMRFLVDELEALGYRWAYRTVDSRFTGVPQRRRRVILIASKRLDPRMVLFADDAGPRPTAELREDAYGFYWTEGRRGLGWAQDAVPTLKGGSAIGIPSPPCIWVPGNDVGRQFVIPMVEEAEVMQGFDRGWTAVGAQGARGPGARWKMVGNAVTVGVSHWVGSRLAKPGEPLGASSRHGDASWPLAAHGTAGEVWAVAASEWPLRLPPQHLTDVVDVAAAPSISPRAFAGFWRRLQAGNLGRHSGFRDALAAHEAWLADCGASAA